MLQNAIVVMIVACLAFATSNCGTKVGNPDDDSESSAFLPTISFGIPDAVTSLSLTQPPGGGPDDGGGNTGGSGGSGGSSGETPDLIPVVKRVDKYIRDVNVTLERLNKDGVDGVGTYDGVGPGGKITVVVSEPSDAAFAYQATICYEGTAFSNVSWSEDKKQVQLVRDLAVSPVAPENITTAVFEINYEEQDGTNILQVYADSEPPEQPTMEEVDGSLRVESIYATKTDDDYFRFRQVADWYADELTAPEGDYYVVGQFDGEATGDFVAYRKNHFNCGEFSEANEDDPGWCLSRPLGGDELDDDERLALWQDELSDFGIEPASGLKQVSLPDDLSCGE